MLKLSKLHLFLSPPHQIILEQKAAQASETDLKMQVQLEQALQQISQLSTALCDIQLYYQDRVGKRDR